MDNGTLIINGVKKEDEGVYQCTVANEVGSPLVKSAILRVIGEKHIQYVFDMQFCNIFYLISACMSLESFLLKSASELSF